MVIGNKKKITYYLIVFILVIFWSTISFTKANFDRLGWQSFIVQSQSMESSLPLGCLVIVKSQPSYFTGDIITFSLKDSPNKGSLTHRIFKIIKWQGQTMFVTKGDANTTVDNQIISQDEIIGKVFYKIPYLGMFIYVSQTKIGSFFYIIAPVLLIIFIEVKNIMKALKKKK